MVVKEFHRNDDNKLIDIRCVRKDWDSMGLKAITSSNDKVTMLLDINNRSLLFDVPFDLDRFHAIAEIVANLDLTSSALVIILEKHTEPDRGIETLVGIAIKDGAKTLLSLGTLAEVLPEESKAKGRKAKAE